MHHRPAVDQGTHLLADDLPGPASSWCAARQPLALAQLDGLLGVCGQNGCGPSLCACARSWSCRGGRLWACTSSLGSGEVAQTELNPLRAAGYPRYQRAQAAKSCPHVEIVRARLESRSSNNASRPSPATAPHHRPGRLSSRSLAQHWLLLCSASQTKQCEPTGRQRQVCLWEPYRGHSLTRGCADIQLALLAPLGGAAPLPCRAEGLHGGFRGGRDPGTGGVGRGSLLGPGG